VGVVVVTIGGGGKGRVIAPQQELLAVGELPWQLEGEEEEGGWNGKSLIAMQWLPTGQSPMLRKGLRSCLFMAFH
jgi:hypothetical protein